MITTIVADDHQLVRKGIVTLLSNTEDIDIVGEASDGIEAIELIEAQSPAVAIMDISMPRLDGIQATERYNGDTNIIILSMHDDETLVRRAFSAGARGYVLKNSVTEELLLAVRAAADGNVFLSPGISSILLEDCMLDENSVSNVLTPREKEVLQLVAEGFTNKKIGETLFISSKTVEKHRKHCMDKLGVSDLPTLIREAIKHSLILIDPLD